MITIDNYQVHDSKDLSAHGRAVMPFIADSRRWLAWAAPDNAPITLELGSEDELFLIMQDGMHNSLRLPLGDFEGSIDLILSMNRHDLHKLMEDLSSSNSNDKQDAETGEDEPVSEDEQSLLRKYGIVTTQALQETVDPWLEQLGLVGDDIFTWLDLSDMLTLYRFITGFYNDLPTSTRKKLGEAASKFAIARAVTVPEYCDLFCFYAVMSRKIKAKKDKDARIADYYEDLNTSLNFALLTPQIDAQVSARQLKEAVQLALAEATYIGFETKAAAMQFIATQFHPESINHKQFSGNIGAFLEFVCTELAQTKVPRYWVSQEGRYRVFPYRNPFVTAVGVSRQGYVTILPEYLAQRNH